MKTLIPIILLSIVLAGCGKSKQILFCEGISKQGEGVHCGEKFEAGDLTAVIKSDGPFETDSITVDIYRVENTLEHMIHTVTAETKPDETQATTTLSFYKGGTYRVKAVKGDAVLAQSDIEIVDY